MAILTGLSGLAQLINFTYRVWMARLVGAEVMGLYQLVMSAYSVIQAITTVGLTACMANLTAQYLARRNDLGVRQLRGSCLRWFFALMLPVGAVVILASDGISVELLGDARTRLGLILLIPCLTLTGMENIHKNAFYGAGIPIPPAAAEVAEQVVRAAAILGLLWWFLPQYPERAVGLILAGMALCEIFSACNLWLLYRWRFPKGGGGPGESARQRRKRMWAIALPVGANALLGNWLGAANAALVPRMLIRGGMERSRAIAELGVVCGMTLPMLALPTVYLGAVNLVLMPKMTRAAALKQREELRRLIARGMETVCLLTVPCMGMMVVLGEDLGRLLYGREDVGTYLLPLALGMGVNCCVCVLATALNSIDRQRTVACITLLGGAVQLLCTCLLTPLPGIGMGGYVAGALLTHLLELALCLRAVMRETGLRPDWFGWAVVPGLAGALAGWNSVLLLRLLQDKGLSPLWAGIVTLLFGGVQYAVTGSVLRRRPEVGRANAER